MTKSNLPTLLFLLITSLNIYASPVTNKELVAIKNFTNTLYQKNKDVLPMTIENNIGKENFIKIISKRNITLNAKDAYEIITFIHQQENKIARLEGLLNYSINQTHYDPRQDPKIKHSNISHL